MKPCLPSSASAGPLKPSRTRVAAIRPLSGGPPTWERLVHAPLARNCMLPAHCDGPCPSRGHVVGGQAEHASGRRRRAECAAGGGGMEAAVGGLARGQRERDAAGGLIARDDADEHLGAGAPPISPAARAAGIAGAPGARSRRVRVIEVERMGHARSGRPPRRACTAPHRRTPRHCWSPFRSRELATRTTGDSRIVPRLHDVADQIEHQVPRARHHLGGNAARRMPAVKADRVAVTPMLRFLLVLGGILPESRAKAKFRRGRPVRSE